MAILRLWALFLKGMGLDAGAVPKVQNGQGATALTFAATLHLNHLAQRRLQAGADKSIADKFGKTRSTMHTCKAM
jgi:hypothetical protein